MVSQKKMRAVLFLEARKLSRKKKHGLAGCQEILSNFHDRIRSLQISADEALSRVINKRDNLAIAIQEHIDHPHLLPTATNKSLKGIKLR